ncbi:hypothetical protein EJ02DRAFT_331243, partial [Clathrospora elynae]
PSQTKTITSEHCETSNKNIWSLQVQTGPKPNAFPSSLQKKLSGIQTIGAGDLETWAKTSKAC